MYDDAQTIYALLNINQHSHTYLKSAVDKLKNGGVEYIFIDEVSMINSKVWRPCGQFLEILKKYMVLNLS